MDQPEVPRRNELKQKIGILQLGVGRFLTVLEDLSARISNTAIDERARIEEIEILFNKACDALINTATVAKISPPEQPPKPEQTH